MKRALLLAAALAAGCASLPLPAPTRADQALMHIPQTPDRWRRWESVHMTVDTDVDEAHTFALIRELERSVEAFDALLLPEIERPRSRLRVVLFADPAQYEALRPRRWSGHYSHFEPDGEPTATIWLSAAADLGGAVVMFEHELTHRYLDRLTPQAPTWLNEGFAVLWSSLWVAGSWAQLGYTPPSMESRDVAALMRTDFAGFHAERDERRHYILAGAFVEFLWLEQHERFVQALRQLIAGGPAAQALEPFAADAVAADFERWYVGKRREAAARTSSSERYMFAAPDPPPPSEPRRLTSAEVLLLCAVLERSRPEPAASERARTWVQAAVAFDPFDPAAYYWAGVFTPLDPGSDGGIAAYATALALQPDHVRALAGLAEQRLQLRKRIDDLSDVEPLIARIPPRTSLVMPLRALASYAHARGRDDDALRYIRRALQTSPGCTQCRWWLATLHNALGEFASADRELERAIALNAETTAEQAKQAHQNLVDARTFIRGCTNRDASACEKLAIAYNGGLGVPIDWARGLQIARRACDAGSAEACRSVAWALRNGYGADRDPAASTALMTRACDAKNWDACNDLGDAYENGVGVPTDVARAVTLYGDACENGAAWGCMSLASLGWRGLGVAHDEAQIVEWIKRAASLSKTIIGVVARGCPRDVSMCAVSALAFAYGLGVEAADRERARDLMSMGCAHGDAAACRAR